MKNSLSIRFSITLILIVIYSFVIQAKEISSIKISYDLENNLNFKKADNLCLNYSKIEINNNLSSKEEDKISYYIDSYLDQKDILEKSVNSISNSSFAFNLFSHGRPGELLIKGKWLNAEQIAFFLKNTPQYSINNSQLLNIYGCEFAKGKKGMHAVAYLEDALGLSVAASTNVTGKKGDWILEVGDFNNSVVLPSYDYNLQLDKKHYLPPYHGQTYDTNNYDYEEIHLSTPSTSTIVVTVTDGSGALVGAGNGLGIGKYEISNGNPAIVSFGDSPPSAPISVLESEIDQVLSASGHGVIFESTDDFYVNYRVNSYHHAAFLTSKGLRASSGRHFKWAAPPHRAVYNNQGGNIISIMAVETSVVTISDYNPNIVFKEGTVDLPPNSGNTIDNHADTRTFSLGAGESIILELVPTNLVANRDGHIGADILSTGDIVVNTGGNVLVEANNNADHAIDQLVPIDALGFDHVIVQGNGTNDSEGVTVTAAFDGTQLQVNGQNFGAVLNEGDYIRISGTNFTSQNMFVSSNKGIYVHHVLYGTAGDARTIGMNFIPPLVCFMPKKVDEIPDYNKIGTTTYSDSELIVITRSGASVSINGTPTTVAPSPVAGSNGFWETYKISGLSTDDYTVESTESMAAGVFGASGAAGFAGFFSGFGNNPIISAGDDPICDAATLSVISTGNWSMYQWYKDDVAIPGATSDSYEAEGQGVYYVVVSDNGSCDSSSNSLTIYESPEINIPPTQTYCDDIPTTLTLSDLDTDEYTGTFYDAMTDGNELLPSTLISSQTYYFEVDNLENKECYPTERFPIQVILNANPDTSTISISSNGPICLDEVAVVTLSGLDISTMYEINYSTDGGVTNTSLTVTTDENGSATLISDMLSETMTYEVTSLSYISTGCSTVPSEVISEEVIVTGNPEISGISISSNSPICSGEDVIVTLNGLEASTVYEINYTTDEGVTNTSVSVTTDENGSTVMVTEALLATIGYEVTSVSFTSTECSSVPSEEVLTEVIVTDNPEISTVSISSNSPICSGDDAVVTLNGLETSTQYEISYTTDAGVTTTGVSITTDENGSAVMITEALSETMIYEVTNVSYTSTGCNAIPSEEVSTEVIVTDNPEISSVNISSNSPICSGEDAVVTLNGLDPNTLYEISYTTDGGVTNISVSVSTDENGLATLITEMISGTTIYDVVSIAYTLTSCSTTIPPDMPLSTEVVMNPLPIVTASSNSNEFCSGGNSSINLDCIFTMNLSSTSIIEWNWEGPSDFTSNIKNPIISPITSLNTGVYTVTVVDNNGCINSAEVNVTVNDTPSIQTNPVDETEVNADDGMLSVIITGGTPPYTVVWDLLNLEDPNGTPQSQDGIYTGENVSNVAPGIYRVTVTDSLGCSVFHEMVVNPFNCNTAVVIDSITPNSVLCTGESTGSATALVSAQFTPLTYIWTDSSNNVVGENSSFLENVPTGVYTLTVIDSKGCTSEGTVSITEPPLGLVLNVTSSDPTTNTPGNEGTAVVSVTGGVSDYTYSWLDSSNTEIGSTAIVTGLVADIYTVIVTDANGCIASATVIINALLCNSLSISTNFEPINCHGDTTIVAAEISGGNGGFVVTWSNTLGEELGTGLISPSLTGGIYIVHVVDNANCESTNTVTISEPAELTLGIAVNPVACKGDSTGSLDLAVNGGVLPYSFNWVGPNGFTSTNEDLNSLLIGDYLVTVTDNNGCQISLERTVTEPDEEVSVSITPSSDSIVCYGETITATATASGGTVGDPSDYSYVWNTDPVQTSSVAVGLGAGTYIVTVTDLNGCTDSETLIVLDEILPLPILTIGDIVCNETSYSVEYFTNATNLINSTSGTITNEYIIDIPLGTDITVSAFNALGCTVDLTVLSPEGCSSDCELPNLSAGQGVCSGDDFYSVSFFESTGANITASSGNVDLDLNIITDIPLGSNLTIVANNDVYCNVSILVESPENCEEDCINPFISIGGVDCNEDGSPTYVVNYVLGDNNTLTVSPDEDIVIGSNSIVVPSLQDIVISVMNSNCEEHQTINISGVECDGCTEATINLLEAQCENDVLTVPFELSNPEAIVTVDIGEVVGNTITNLSNEDVVTITLYVGDFCVSTVTKTVVCPEVLCAPFDIFKQFSPNGDNQNDLFIINCIENYPQNTLQVFNRLGQLVHKVSNYQNDWDGTASVSGVISRGAKLAEGTYYFVFEGVDEDGEFIKVKDWLYIKY